jgi:hypothetical protein
MPRKLKILQPDASVENIRTRLRKLRCRPDQVDLHVSRPIAIKNKPKQNHYVEIGGGHRAQYIENSTRKLARKNSNL